jgi:hypothetical protein
VYVIKLTHMLSPIDEKVKAGENVHDVLGMIQQSPSNLYPAYRIGILGPGALESRIEFCCVM